MKAILTRFVTDESGEGIFDDPFIAVVVAIGCVASLYFIMLTLGGVYEGVAGILNAATPSADYEALAFRNSSGNFAMFAATRRAPPSLVSSLAAARRPGSSSK
jgi:Flp pilus assembly pilin Flp